MVEAKGFPVTPLFNPKAQSFVHDGRAGQPTPSALAVDIREDIILQANRYQLRHTDSIPHTTYRLRGVAGRA